MGVAITPFVAVVDPSSCPKNTITGKRNYGILFNFRINSPRTSPRLRRAGKWDTCDAIIKEGVFCEPGRGPWDFSKSIVNYCLEDI